MIAAFRALVLTVLVTCLCQPISAALFAVSSGSDSVLYRIDLETSAVIRVGSTGVDHLTGLAYHPR